MAVNYDLNNTGQEVQERLDQVMPNKTDIEQEALDRQSGDNALQEQIDAINTEIGESGQGGETINGRLDELETAVGSGGSVDERIADAKAEVVGGASEDYDTLGKVEGELVDTYRKNETYSKEQLDSLITTPDVNYVTVIATSGTTDVTTLLPNPGAADTVYRVGNWDGTQYDPTVYSLYAWNGSAYILLAVRTSIGEVYDISVNHPDGQGNPAVYTGLANALGTSGANVPGDIRRGGMSVKFIQGSEYVQYRLMATVWSTTPSDWQGVDTEPTTGSRNLVESGGVIIYNNRTALNRRYIEGADNTYKSITIRGFIEGRIYKIEFKNPQWARTNVPSASNFLIRIVLNDANNNTVETIVEILANSSRLLEKSYIFKVPANVEYLLVGGRADVGELIDFSLFDVTDLFAIDSNQSNGLQNKKTNVFIEPITEHGNVTFVGNGSAPVYKYIRFKYSHSYKVEFPVTDFDKTGVSSSQAIFAINDGTNDIVRIEASDTLQSSYVFTPTDEIDYYCLILRAAVGESVTLFITDNTLEEELIEDNYTADFSISDENNYDIARFSGGHIITMNFDSSKTPSVDNTESISDLDVTDGSGNVLMSLKDGNIQTKYFDSSKLSLPQKPYSRRIFFNTYVNTRNFLVGNFTPEAINNYEDGTFYKDNCVLYLPQTYTQNRDKTKLIIYCKYGSSAIEEDSDTILTDTMGKIFRYMLKLGYAILAADGVPNGWIDAIKISERVCGNYVAVQSTIKAYNYVINNYNIDANGAMIFGWSQGGAYALNVIENTNIPICGAALLSPVISLRYHLWDVGSTVTIDGVTYTEAARLNIARIFDFPAFTTNAELLALEYDYTKTQGFDPWFKNVENMYEGFTKEGTLWKLPSGTTLDDIQMKKHLRCPIKVWCAVNDETLSCDVMEVFVKALKNAGASCDISVKSTGGHNIPNNQSSIGSFTENGQSVNLYPIAKDIALWFNINGGYKL